MQLNRLSRPQAPMTAVTWQQLLKIATTPDEVIAASRDFIANIDHTQLARLPEQCKPGKLLDTHDVAAYAYELVRHHCSDETDPEVAETVRTLADFFSQAVGRLSVLAAPRPASSEMVKLFSN